VDSKTFGLLRESNMFYYTSV